MSIPNPFSKMRVSYFFGTLDDAERMYKSFLIEAKIANNHDEIQRYRGAIEALHWVKKELCYTQQGYGEIENED